MEKYVLEALFVMGEAEYGLERMKKRFLGMVEKSEYTTLEAARTGSAQAPIITPGVEGA